MHFRYTQKRKMKRKMNTHVRAHMHTHPKPHVQDLSLTHTGTRWCPYAFMRLNNPAPPIMAPGPFTPLGVHNSGRSQVEYDSPLQKHVFLMCMRIRDRWQHLGSGNRRMVEWI